MNRALLILLCVSFTGCATARERFLLGVGAGGAAGAVGGAALAPEKDRGLNAVVFGLTGALAGGVLAVVLKDDSKIPEHKATLKERELSSVGSEFLFEKSQSSEMLPDFVKSRLQPVVIEEYTERESIAKDGSLRAPHKVWRIKYPATLLAKPVRNPTPRVTPKSTPQGSNKGVGSSKGN